MTLEQYQRHKDYIHELIVGDYFRKHWVGNTLAFEKSGSALVDKINALNPKSVLDVGCGYNLYRDKIKCELFVGIDPYNDNATIKMSTVEFANNYREDTQQFDVVMALGSINFGSVDKIYQELAAVDKMLKKGGHLFIRANPGLPHKHSDYPLVDLIEFYPWSKYDSLTISHLFGYKLIEFNEETNKVGDKRLFFHYYK